MSTRTQAYPSHSQRARAESNARPSSGHPGLPLRGALQGFMLSREARGCTPATLEHYAYTAGGFVSWLEGETVSTIEQVSAHHIRAYLVSLQRRDLKDTTQHAHARGIKAWLNWLVNEEDLVDTPMRKVAMPRLAHRVLPPFTEAEVQALLRACDRKAPLGARNYALVLSLVDTGLRAAEITSLRMGDVDMHSGMATVLGKGRKQRMVRVGSRARGAIGHMLAFREPLEAGDPLWATQGFASDPAGPLSVHGLQTMLVRLGRHAGVTPCAPHRFRRTFALWMLRDGCDLESLRRLMGHASLDVLLRYLALEWQDMERAHVEHSPGDKLLQSRGGARTGRHGR